MVNRKGFIKIVEASIAILIVFTVIIILISRNNVSRNEDLSKLIQPILEEIALKNQYREKILSYNIDNPTTTDAEIITELENFVGTRVRSGINSKVRICKGDDDCLFEGEITNEIYAGERIISTDLQGDPNISRRKVKIFLWKND